MIYVELNKMNFDYDIRALVRSFYPKETVSIETVKGLEPCFMYITIFYTDDGIEIEIGNEKRKIKDQKENDYTNRSDTKNVLKRMLYGLFSQWTEKELAWGTLSGIRPTKIVLNQLLAGESEESIGRMMKENYLISPSKLELCLEITKQEKKVIEQVDNPNGYCLYVNIPFCPSTCLYCSFTSNNIGHWKDRIDNYLDALLKELEKVSQMMIGRSLVAIYIGGGTPTTLIPSQLERLLTAIDRYFDRRQVVEYTVEAGRPDSITREKLQVLLDHEISRISINPQTMKQKTLDIIGRWHSVEQTVEAFELARSMGFDCINMDIIVGLPNENIEDVENTLKQIKALNPDNLTVHSLALKKKARLNIHMEDYETLSMENSQEIMDLVDFYGRSMGQRPYYLYRQKNMAGNMENVGYARPGKAGVYNILIMEERETIVAVGAGAITKKVIQKGQEVQRVENVKDVNTYMNRIDDMIERKREAQIWL